MAKGALRGHRDFRLLWGGETVSELGSQISLLAIPLLAVNSLHATAFEMGLLTAASTAAFLIVGLPAGVWVDRVRRRRLMIATDLGRFLALGSIPIAYAVGGLTLVQLFVVTLASGILTVFFDVAYQSYLPSLVGREHLVEGNAKLTGSAQVAAVAGPSVAGGLVQAIGSSAAVAVDAGSFLISAVAVGAIRTPEPKTGAARRAGIPGWSRALRKASASSSAMPCSGRSRRPLPPPTSSAASPPQWRSSSWSARSMPQPGVIGLLFALGGVGGVAGALAAGPIARRFGGARATIIGIAVQCRERC